MNVTRLFPVVSIFALMAGIAACSSTSGGENVGDDEGAERWDNANNPARVDPTFVYSADALPVAGGVVVAPIAADYWATATDSINKRWDGDNPSPAAKFGTAFGKGDTAVERAVSEDTGIRAYDGRNPRSVRKECTASSECTSLGDGSMCAIPRGETKGRCIPGWWGICHGWAPYAFSEPAAKNPVTKNGVTFYAGDLEALMSLVYGSGLETKFLSSRCNKTGNPDEPGTKVTVDSTGRVVDGECRDMNPGSFHIVVANKLGLRKESFVYDRTWDGQVWNQPVRDYKITNANGDKLKEVSKQEAASLLGIGSSVTILEPMTTLAKGVTKKGTYTARTAGDLVFKTTGTGDADLYIRKGDEASDSANDCSSAQGASLEECKLTVAVGDVIHYTLLGYADSSDVELQLSTPATADVAYTFNPDAKRFFHVRMDFRYMSEPKVSSRTPADVERFTSVDHYEYVLEADQAGTIIGGEWMGSSRTEHPDFVWWPVSKPAGTVAGGLISYAEVKELNDQAAGVQPSDDRAPTTTTLLSNVSIAATQKEERSIAVPAGATLTLKLSGTGNGNMYVREGLANAWACTSTNAGSTESCKLTAPPGAMTSYMVRVRAVAASTVTLVATITR